MFQILKSRFELVKVMLATSSSLIPNISASFLLINLMYELSFLFPLYGAWCQIRRISFQNKILRTYLFNNLSSPEFLKVTIPPIPSFNPIFNYLFQHLLMLPVKAWKHPLQIAVPLNSFSASNNFTGMNLLHELQPADHGGIAIRSCC